MATAIFEEGARQQCAQSEVIRANYPKIADRWPKTIFPAMGPPGRVHNIHFFHALWKTQLKYLPTHVRFIKKFITN